MHYRAENNKVYDSLIEVCRSHGPQSIEYYPEIEDQWGPEVDYLVWLIEQKCTCSWRSALFEK